MGGNDCALATDEMYMRRALDLARRGAGWVNPNPMVGAVIVRDGCIIGEGWHTAFGELHAERQAIAHCVGPTEGATIYVTLEPCCHTGKTPPCTEALIDAGFARVVMGAPDANPLVAGKGVACLRAAGIEVVEGVLRDECVAINRAFFHHIQTGLPYVTLKYAMTMDGKIATCAGDSQWITGPDARLRVHEDRRAAAAIMVGVNTVLADNPSLTCRVGDFGVDPLPAEYADVPARYLEPHSPVRIVCDSHVRTPLESALVQTARETPTIIATLADNNDARVEAYRSCGVDVIALPAVDGRIDLAALMRELGARGIDSVIVEGGGQLAFSALSAGIVNRVQAYVGSKIFGGAEAISPVEGAGFARVADAVCLAHPRVEQLGGDVLIESEVL